MRRSPSPSGLSFCVLLGLALAVSITSGLSCGSTTNASCDSVYDPNRRDPNGELDPCCERTFPCPPPDAGKDAGKDAAADADGGPPPTDADATAEGCTGTCLEFPPFGWFGPGLFWKGDAGATMACPAAAPVPAYTGFADLDAGPASCGACGCEPSPGNACGPPEHLTASTAACPGGVYTAPFDPPPAWDGGCSTFDDVPAAKSLTSGPLTLTETCVADAGVPDAAGGLRIGRRGLPRSDIGVRSGARLRAHRPGLPDVHLSAGRRGSLPAIVPRPDLRRPGP